MRGLRRWWARAFRRKSGRVVELWDDVPVWRAVCGKASWGSGGPGVRGFGTHYMPGDRASAPPGTEAPAAVRPEDGPGAWAPGGAIRRGPALTLCPRLRRDDLDDREFAG